MEIEKNINHEWTGIKFIFRPRTRRKTIEEKLVELFLAGRYEFAASRFGQHNYRLNIPQGEYMQVGFVRRKA